VVAGGVWGSNIVRGRRGDTVALSLRPAVAWISAMTRVFELVEEPRDAGVIQQNAGFPK